MTWVIDCSFSSSLFLPNKYSKKATSFFNKLPPEEELIVPGLWWYELTNVLLVSVRRKILPHFTIVQVLNLFEQFGLVTVNLSGPDNSEDMYELGQLYKLSAYDASYLDLAIKRTASLATFDKKLLNAARKAGIRTFPL